MKNEVEFWSWVKKYQEERKVEVTRYARDFAWSQYINHGIQTPLFEKVQALYLEHHAPKRRIEQENPPKQLGNKNGSIQVDYEDYALVHAVLNPALNYKSKGQSARLAASYNLQYVYMHCDNHKRLMPQRIVNYRRYDQHGQYKVLYSAVCVSCKMIQRKDKKKRKIKDVETFIKNIEQHYRAINMRSLQSAS